MSKLSEMIATLCPNGVEHRPLWSVTIWDKKFNAVERSKQPKIIKYNYFLANDLKPLIVEGGNVKLLTTSISNMFTSEEIAGDKLSEGEVVTIPWGGNPNVQYYKGKFLTADNRIATSSDCKVLDNKYLFYFMQSKRDLIGSYYRGSGIKHPDMAKVLDMMIPLPPLPIQREIVQTLDNFANLTAELTAELAKRKKQYEHYRDILFEPSTDTWARVTVEDIADTFVGLATSVTPYQRESGVLLIHNSDVQQNEIVLKQRVYLDDAFVRRNSKKLFQKDDIVTVHTGDVGTSAVISDEYVGCIVFTTLTTRIRDTTKVLPRYLAHYFNSHRCKQDIATKTISDRSNLNQSSFSRLSIPLPPLAEQKRIVAILDRFDSLCNSLTEGLPAEIALRKKQYEYYRDKLLSFKEAG